MLAEQFVSLRIGRCDDFQAAGLDYCKAALLEVFADDRQNVHLMRHQQKDAGAAPRRDLRANGVACRSNARIAALPEGAKIVIDLDSQRWRNQFRGFDATAPRARHDFRDFYAIRPQPRAELPRLRPSGSIQVSLGFALIDLEVWRIADARGGLRVTHKDNEASGAELLKDIAADVLRRSGRGRQQGKDNKHTTARHHEFHNAKRLAVCQGSQIRADDGLARHFPRFQQTQRFLRIRQRHNRMNVRL